MRLASQHCVVSDNIHSYPKEDNIDWKFQSEGEGGLKHIFSEVMKGVAVQVKSADEPNGSSGQSLF